jgi:hypothetical protein
MLQQWIDEGHKEEKIAINFSSLFHHCYEIIFPVHNDYQLFVPVPPLLSTSTSCAIIIIN